MRKSYWFFAIIAGLVILSTIEIYKANTLTKKLKTTQRELEHVKDKLDNAEDQIQNIKDKFGDDWEQKMNSIASYASELENSIDDLMREISFADCDCCDDFWYVESKARTVKSNFEDLQSEIDY